MQSAVRCPFFQKAFGWCLPIGGLAGLVRLGGGEFRLPILMYVIGYPAKTAVPLNLAVSLVVVVVGELLIPTMMFIFGADIKTAGTASIVISVCVVTSGLWRYWRVGAIETRLGTRCIVSAMSVGSLLERRIPRQTGDCS